MTLNDAINGLKGEQSWREGLKQYLRAESMRLGIEALKWIKEERELQGILYPGLLPGETKE